MRSVELFGESFAVTDDVGDVEFAFLEFQEVAGGTDAESSAGGAAVMGLLRACLAHDEDWPRFKQVCRKNRARVERDLMPLVVDVMEHITERMEHITERPTQRPSVSTDGPERTAPNSTAPSSSPAIDRLRVRPDLMVIVEDSQASRAG